ncbi:MAG TPA: hydrogenase nickel incorporation protein HypB, partial [Promineifilum sp.]|nr:hydrogenase nickel incorporation protein HypB [Promineifilum sp.]
MITERVPVVEKILGANDRLAADNRARLDAAGVYSLNFLASPGAGKTSLVEQTVGRLAGRLRLAVVDGDIATSLDADRAAAAGAKAVQINTGGECHLDAVMLQGALEALDLPAVDLLIVEN